MNYLLHPHILQQPCACTVVIVLILRFLFITVVQSTDKNFMVPVGGAVVLSPSPKFIDAVSNSYPGRASMTPILDLFITLLSMGQDGYRTFLRERLRVRSEMLSGLQALCDKHGLQILSAPGNTISTGVSLSALLGALQERTINTVSIANQGESVNSSSNKMEANSVQGEQLSFLGSMLYQRCVSGCRVVTCTGETKQISGFPFTDWGAHINAYPHHYLTVACSVGITDQDVVLFLERLDKVLVRFKKRYQGAQEAEGEAEGEGTTSPAEKAEEGTANV